MISLAYLAGIVDGEGTVRLEKHGERYWYPRLTVTNTYKPMLEVLQAEFGGKVTLHYRKGTATGKAGRQGYVYTRDCWRWDTAGNNAVRILEEILPFLLIKREKALDVLGQARFARSPRDLQAVS